MKRFTSIMLILCFIMIFASCAENNISLPKSTGKISPAEGQTKEINETGATEEDTFILPALSEDYTMEQAKADGCLVIDSTEYASHPAEFDSGIDAFIEKAKAGENAFIREMYYKDGVLAEYVDVWCDENGFYVKEIDPDGNKVIRSSEYVCMRYERTFGSKTTIDPEGSYVYRYLFINDHDNPNAGDTSVLYGNDAKAEDFLTIGFDVIRIGTEKLTDEDKALLEEAKKNNTLVDVKGGKTKLIVDYIRP